MMRLLPTPLPPCPSLKRTPAPVKSLFSAGTIDIDGTLSDTMRAAQTLSEAPPRKIDRMDYHTLMDVVDYQVLEVSFDFLERCLPEKAQPLFKQAHALFRHNGEYLTLDEATVLKPLLQATKSFYDKRFAPVFDTMTGILEAFQKSNSYYWYNTGSHTFDSINIGLDAGQVSGFSQGRKALATATTEDEKELALKKILGIGGRNKHGSCALLADTHIKILTTGQPWTQVPKTLTKSRVWFSWQPESQKIRGTYFCSSDEDPKHLAPNEELRRIQNYDQQLGVNKQGWQYATDKWHIENELRQAGHGAIAYLGLWDKAEYCHSAIAINIRGDVFIVDNGEPSPTRYWRPDAKRSSAVKYQYAILKKRLHPVFDPPSFFRSIIGYLVPQRFL